MIARSMVCVTAGAIAAIRAHAEAGLPREVAGVLGADETGTIIVAIPVEAARSGPHAVSVPRVAVEDATRRITLAGLRRAGTYHSHPRAHAVPSEADRLAMMKDEIVVIVGFRGQPRVCAYRLSPDGYHARALTLEVAPAMPP